MAAVVGTMNRRGLRIEAHHRIKPLKSILVLYNPILLATLTVIELAM